MYKVQGDVPDMCLCLSLSHVQKQWVPDRSGQLSISTGSAPLGAGPGTEAPPPRCRQ